MFEHMQQIGGALMASMLLIGTLSRAGFAENAGRVTITPDMMKDADECILYVDGAQQKVAPGVYEPALLLVRHKVEHAAHTTRDGDVQAVQDSMLTIYVDRPEEKV